ncbi:MAG TPA: cytochrome c [Burkholderiales bacterium]|nr:cytochrome c [Burkholderiales bacterium]
MLRRSPALAGLFFLLFTAIAFAQGDAKRGEYLSKAGGCIGCHTEMRKDAQPFAGGRALKTPFGTFYGPNITPDPKAGIGLWKEADFMRAMREGKRPDGANYFPAFPYSSFTRISDADLRDLWAYLRTLKPSAQPSKEHELGFFYRWRFLVTVWKWLFFDAGALAPDPARSEPLNRGRYLVDALGHCGECHTPRNFLGGPKRARYLGGAKLGDDVNAPNITPTRLKKYAPAELKDILTSGLYPDGDVMGETMSEVVKNTTSQLTAADLDALIAYLLSIVPLPDEPK